MVVVENRDDDTFFTFAYMHKHTHTPPPSIPPLPPILQPTLSRHATPRTHATHLGSGSRNVRAQRVRSHSTASVR